MRMYSSNCILKGICVCIGIKAPMYKFSQPHVEAQRPEVDFRCIFQSFFHLIFPTLLVLLIFKHYVHLLCVYGFICIWENVTEPFEGQKMTCGFGSVLPFGFQIDF